MTEFPKTKTVQLYTCSKCNKANATIPAMCCENGNMYGEKINVEIPDLPNTKFFTDFFGCERIMTKKQVEDFFISCIYQNKKYEIASILKTLVMLKKITREGKTHDLRCEYAIGNSCVCWCAEKFHGWKGAEMK